jgi:hypothetical protein
MAAALLIPSEELARLGERLVREHTEQPAAVVLQSVTEAFRRAQAWGCPPEHLVATVEASALWELDQQLAAGPAPTRPGGPVVPRQFSGPSS